MNILANIEKIKHGLGLALILGIITGMHSPVVSAAELGCENTSVDAVPLVETEATGRSLLCVKSNNLKGRMTVEGLVPDNAYTTWWVYVDKPECFGGILTCGIASFLGDDPRAVFGRMASGVAPRKGKLHFSDSLDGMQVSAGSEIWFLTFGHGAAALDDGRQLARQLLTPEDPNAGAPHLGIIGRHYGYPVAISVFKID